MPVLALLVLLPVIEITLFILAGAELGFLPTLGLVLLTSAIGVLVLRMQGSVTLRQMQEAQRSLTAPTGPIAHGALSYVAGFLLVLPGFFTDAIGLLLLLPPVRRMLLSRMSMRFATAQAAAARHYSAQYPRASDDIIDGEATEIFPEARPLPNNRPSAWTNPPDEK